MAAIKFNHITKTFTQGLFKKNCVVDDLSVEVQRGEVFGFLGPNGAGKSTSIKLLMNFIHPDNGEIFVNNIPVTNNKYLSCIGYLPETPCFYENLTALELLRFSCRVSGMPAAGFKDKAMSILRRLNLDHAADLKIKTYSKGMKQRIGLAIAIVHDPDIYILDEPMSGLDPMGRRLITDVILELRERGKTVFFSSHILSDVEKLCDRVAILNKGKVLFSGPASDMVQNGLTFEDSFINIIQQNS